MAAHGIPRGHCHHRRFCCRCGRFSFDGWLSRCCLRISSSRLCLCLYMRNLGLLRPCRLLSTGASPPICLLFAVWLSHRLVPPPCVTFCRAAAARIHPRPLLFVHASWLSRRISLHRLRLSTCRCLTTGCVVAIANAQPSMRRRLCRCQDCNCHPCCKLSSWRCHPRCPSPSSLSLFRFGSIQNGVHCVLCW